MVAGLPHGKWQSKWIPPNAKCNCTQMLIFHLLCIQNLFFFAADVHLFYCPVLPHYIWNESTFSMNPRESIIRFGVVCVYKCGSNEVVSPVTTLPALRGSLIYHSNAPPPAFYLSLPWTAYTSGWWFLKLWALRCWGGVLGWWQGQMGSVMGHSHHRRPPPACCTDRLEKQGGRRALPLPPFTSPCLPPQNCFDLGLAFHLTPNCDSFPLPSPRTQIISGVTQGWFQKKSRHWWLWFESVCERHDGDDGSGSGGSDGDGGGGDLVEMSSFVVSRQMGKRADLSQELSRQTAEPLEVKNLPDWRLFCIKGHPTNIYDVILKFLHSVEAIW